MSIEIKKQSHLFRKSAYNLLLDILRYNVYANHFPNKSDAAVIKKFNQMSKEWGFLGDFNYFVTKCMNYNETPPFINLADSGIWEAQGCTLSVTDSITGIRSDEFDAIALSSYQGLFYESFKLYEDALKDSTFIFFKSSIIAGISSIEAFIRHKAEQYNVYNKQDVLIDNSNNKISFIDKFDIWIPKMTAEKFDKSTCEWDALKKILNFRNNESIHLKGTYGTNYSELERLMNIYKYAIPGILRKLHIHFKMIIPSNIIIASYYPEISIFQKAT